ncbi:hypothetical protein [Streptomyces hesseae]|uniref:Uncharacterized protein n=1 Tax=Streptomyces hesseae TaxID=3075519 RepID=A0ABU2SSQ0_9ACTN|nr:hypothetical protein [Streptomyces sp. DSM 40473]MDT0452033.1 hypothetical protein [Streptomyces sp. DSM 40473]
MTAPRHALRVIKKSARIALTRSPAWKVGQTVRRRVNTGIATGRDTYVDSVLMPASQGSAARVQYAAVLDGHTLNLHATLPAGTLPEGDTGTTAHVVLVSGTTRLRAEAVLGREENGEISVTATTLLGDTLGGVPVTPGRWHLSLELEPARHEGRAALRLRLLGDGAPLYTGPTRALATCAVTGRRHRLGITPAGQLRLTVAPARARAEVLRVERSFSGVGVLFAIYGSGTAIADGERPVVEVAELDRKHALDRRPAEPLPGDATAWRLTVPLAKLIDTSRKQTLTLRLPRGARGTKPLEIGRHEHDLRSPRQVVTPPKFTVRAADSTFVQVKPQYTRRGALQLVCTPRTPAAGATGPR